MTSHFIVNYLKKVIGGPTNQKNLERNSKTLIYSIWMRPKGTQGVSNDAVGYTKNTI